MLSAREYKQVLFLLVVPCKRGGVPVSFLC
jgi:hypothetical protein